MTFSQISSILGIKIHFSLYQEGVNSLMGGGSTPLLKNSLCTRNPYAWATFCYLKLNRRQILLFLQSDCAILLFFQQTLLFVKGKIQFYVFIWFYGKNLLVLSRSVYFSLFFSFFSLSFLFPSYSLNFSLSLSTSCCVF